MQKILLLMLLLLLTTSVTAEQRSFSEAKSLPDQNEPESFEFSTANSKYRISHDGRGLRTGKSDSRSFSLGLSRSDRLARELYYAEYERDLLLIGEVSDGESGSGFIVRLDGRNLKAKWKQVVSGFNIGPGLIDATYAYVTGIGFIGKINLKSGAYVWRHKNLYRQDNSAFLSFELPQISGRIVLFRESSNHLRKKIAVISVERIQGKIIRLEM
jgi:hypothetical protein